MPQNRRGYGRGRARGRGRGRGHGSGRGAGSGRGTGPGHMPMMMMGRGARGGRTNLIVLTAPPEPPPKPVQGATTSEYVKPEKTAEGSKPLLLLPQDKWAPRNQNLGTEDTEEAKPKRK